MRGGVVVGMAVAAALSGCGASSSAGKVTASSAFDDQGNQAVRCMVHQRHAPVHGDLLSDRSDVEAALTVLHYYTRNGNLPYCDNRPATAIDRQWLGVYLRDGASRSHIARALR